MDQRNVPADRPSPAARSYSFQQELALHDSDRIWNLLECQLGMNKFYTLHWGPSNGRFKTDATTFAVWLVLENGE